MTDQTYVRSIAEAYESEFPGASLNGEWLGTVFEDKPQGSNFSYSEFEEAVELELADIRGYDIDRNALAH